MKYFTSDVAGDNNLGGITAARAFLKAHPEAVEVYRWWWVGHDLIEVEAVSRESLVHQRAIRLMAGQTAQWAHDHGRFAP